MPNLFPDDEVTKPMRAMTNAEVAAEWRDILTPVGMRVTRDLRPNRLRAIAGELINGVRDYIGVTSRVKTVELAVEDVMAP